MGSFFNEIIHTWVKACDCFPLADQGGPHVPDRGWPGWQHIAQAHALTGNSPACSARHLVKVALAADQLSLSGKSVNWSALEQQLRAIATGSIPLAQLPDTQEDLMRQVALDYIIVDKSKDHTKTRKRAGARSHSYLVVLDGQPRQDGEWLTHAQLKSEFPNDYRKMLGDFEERSRGLIMQDNSHTALFTQLHAGCPGEDVDEPEEHKTNGAADSSTQQGGAIHPEEGSEVEEAPPLSSEPRQLRVLGEAEKRRHQAQSAEAEEAEPSQRLGRPARQASGGVLVPGASCIPLQPLKPEPLYHGSGPSASMMLAGIAHSRPGTVPSEGYTSQERGTHRQEGSGHRERCRPGGEEGEAQPSRPKQGRWRERRMPASLTATGNVPQGTADQQQVLAIAAEAAPATTHSASSPKMRDPRFLALGESKGGGGRSKAEQRHPLPSPQPRQVGCGDGGAASAAEVELVEREPKAGEAEVGAGDAKRGHNVQGGWQQTEQAQQEPSMIAGAPYTHHAQHQGQQPPAAAVQSGAPVSGRGRLAAYRRPTPSVPKQTPHPSRSVGSMVAATTPADPWSCPSAAARQQMAGPDFSRVNPLLRRNVEYVYRTTGRLPAGMLVPGQVARAGGAGIGEGRGGTGLDALLKVLPNPPAKRPHPALQQSPTCKPRPPLSPVQQVQHSAQCTPTRPFPRAVGGPSPGSASIRRDEVQQQVQEPGFTFWQQEERSPRQQEALRPAAESAKHLGKRPRASVPEGGPDTEARKPQHGPHDQETISPKQKSVVAACPPEGGGKADAPNGSQVVPAAAASQDPWREASPPTAKAQRIALFMRQFPNKALVPGGQHLDPAGTGARQASEPVHHPAAAGHILAGRKHPAVQGEDAFFDAQEELPPAVQLAADTEAAELSQWPPMSLDLRTQPDEIQWTAADAAGQLHDNLLDLVPATQVVLEQEAGLGQMGGAGVGIAQAEGPAPEDDQGAQEEGGAESDEVLEQLLEPGPWATATITGVSDGAAGKEVHVEWALDGGVRRSVPSSRLRQRPHCMLTLVNYYESRPQ